MTAEALDSYMGYWRRGNDAGDGYAVGREDDTPREAAGREQMEILDAGTAGNVLARDTTGRLVVVCDANGPWAVAVEEVQR